MTKEEEEVVTEFAQVAREFISLMGRVENLTAEQMVRESTSILPRLYQLAFLLPCVEPESVEISKSRRSFEQWKSLYDSIAHMMGEWDFYNHIFNNYEDTKVVGSTLSDDLSDICRDVEDPLNRYESGQVNDAVWEWREGFMRHWGEHTTGAMRAMYWLRRYYL